MPLHCSAMLLLRLLEVYFLGFICGLIPGPVVTALFTETIRKGWRSSRRVIAWAAFGELLMSITCVAVLSWLNPQSILFSALSIFGALLLVSISWDLWRIDEVAEEEPLFSNKKVFFIALLNGMAWIFWITVCTPQAMTLGSQISFGQWLFIFLFELGWISSTFSLALLFGLFRSFFQSNQRIHLLYRTLAFLFLLFAGKLAYGAIQSLLHGAQT